MFSLYIILYATTRANITMDTNSAYGIATAIKMDTNTAYASYVLNIAPVYLLQLLAKCI